MSEQQQPNFAERLAHKALLNEIAALTERAERAEELVRVFKEGPWDTLPDELRAKGMPYSARWVERMKEAMDDHDTARREAGRGE